MKSRRPARRPRGGLLRETLRLWRSQHLGRRPPGTRGTEHVFSLADVGGKSGKAQSKNSSFSPVRHDATPGADVSVFQVLGDCRPRPVFVWRCHPRVASFDRTERSIRTLCVSAAEAPSSFKRCKTSGQAADATIVNCVWALSEGPVGLERAAVIQGEVAMVRPFRVFFAKRS